MLMRIVRRSAGGIEIGEHRARLDGERGHALVGDVQLDHMAGLGESGGRGLGAAVAHLGGDVAGAFIAQQRRAFGGGALEVHHHGQLVVIDHHGLGGIAGLLKRFGDHGRHRLADEAGALMRQGAPGRRCAIGAAGALEGGSTRHGLDASGHQIGPGDHAQHAGHGRCRVGVDRANGRVRVGRAHEARDGPGAAGSDHRRSDRRRPAGSRLPGGARPGRCRNGWGWVQCSRSILKLTGTGSCRVPSTASPDATGSTAKAP